MKSIYPLLMVPEFDPRPWGTLDLSPIYPDHRCTEKIGEAWLTGDHCKIANGPYAGQRLDELTRKFGRDLVGEAAPDESRFPLLLKFLFPHEKLSVQVHPDDAAAQRAGEPWGKTECWYFAHTQPGAQVGLGLRPGVTTEQFAQSVQGNYAEDLLNWVEVHDGDLIYVGAGTVHTLGPGSVLIETQQQSDSTYRLYDYGRPRELHLERGLAAIKLAAVAGKVSSLPASTPSGEAQKLVMAPHFAVNRYALSQSQKFFTGDTGGASSVQILVAIEGEATLHCADCEPVRFTRGDAVVVPASAGEFSVRPNGKAEFLISRVPERVLREPVTHL
jgi:mannose-6-phosphate isomerase